MSQQPPADWYPDPQIAGQLRYWDGTTWTEHTAPQPAQQATPPAWQPAQAAATGVTGGYDQRLQTATASGWRPPPTLGFGDAVRTCLAKSFDAKGRASRSEYWWFALAYFIFVFVAVIAAMVVGFATQSESVAIGLIVVVALCMLALLPASLSAAIRRLHDTDKSGWWLLLGIVPFGSWVLLVFYVLEGTPGPNRYG